MHRVTRRCLSTFSKYVDGKTCRIIGAPLNLGQPLVGVELGPRYIREGNLVEKLKDQGWTVEDEGDLDFEPLKKLINEPQHPLAKMSHIVGGANHMLFNSVSKAAKDNRFVLTLGGDHSVGVGSIGGLISARPDTSVIWIDAHADINTPETSVSKNIHGQVLSYLMGIGSARSIPGFEWLAKVPHFNPQRLVYIGIRDLDVGEKEIIKRLGIKAFTMHDLDKYGVGKVTEMTLDHCINRVERPIHITFDIDAVDPAFAPATGTTSPGGVSFREANYICESVARTKLLSSMDLVEVNPSLSSSDGAKKTVNTAVALITSAMGATIL